MDEGILIAIETITANSDLLTILINNIADNANRHGFTDSSKKYKLAFFISSFFEKIEDKHENSINPQIKGISIEQVYLKIKIANNGNPFPDNFSLEKFVRKNSFAGETGNTGIGGYDINRIVQHHKGKLNLITDDKIGEFSTIYEILIPAYITESFKL